ncbi:ubiquitin family protein [Nocardioides pacificus]
MTTAPLRESALSGAPTDTIAVSVHGPAGVLDLVVPSGAAATDVAREYTAQTGLASVPLLHDRGGRRLAPDASLGSVGIESGDLLVATTGVHRGTHDADAARMSVPHDDGALGTLWVTVAGAVALLAGWFASQTSSVGHQELTIALLTAATVIGVLPIGRYAEARGLAAPAFAGAAAFVVVHEPGMTRLPMTIGVAALAAAVAAAVARTLSGRREEAHLVWVVAGTATFVLTGVCAVLGAQAQVVWSVLLVVAMLSARWVPSMAVDVPDHLLLDLDRLAVTAWSARDRATGRRGRMVVQRAAMEAVVERAARLVTAGAAAVLALVAVAAPMVLRTAELDLDRTGGRVLVLLVGGALLLAARSYRHGTARLLLRAAGLLAWVSLAWVLFDELSPGRGVALASTTVALGLLAALVAVAVGRGWRSVWWSRRAEVAEALCGSFALAALVVASGLFRSLWELTS